MSISWDETFMGATYLIAAKSHDEQTKIGAVIVAPDKTITAWGYNGLPRGVSYRKEIMVAPEKYKWMCHAEENAIHNAHRGGKPIIGHSVYVNLLPCNVCARGIAQAGITEVIVHKNSHDFYMESSEKDQNYWLDAFECTREIFSETGTRLRWLDYQLVMPTGFFNGQVFPTVP